MKKKIINGLLFAAALVVASSSFVSCKDYEGDNIALQQEEMSGLKAALAIQAQDMQKYCLVTDYQPARDLAAEQLAALVAQGVLYKDAAGNWQVNSLASAKDIADAIKDNNSVLNSAITSAINNYITSVSGTGAALDLSKYALQSSLSDYALKSSLSDFALKSEIPDVSEIEEDEVAADIPVDDAAIPTAPAVTAEQPDEADTVSATPAFPVNSMTLSNDTCWRTVRGCRWP